MDKESERKAALMSMWSRLRVFVIKWVEKIFSADKYNLA